MNDDPSKVDVLYGRCIENSGRLQQLADVVVNSLEADGLLDRQYERVKLHATLMNSLFKVKDDSEENVRSTFNAKPILEVIYISITITSYENNVLIFMDLCIYIFVLCMCL
jgi:activating signal cointegrator complex subunit 1